MVQDARRFMRVPARVDVGPVREKEVCDVEVTVDDGPGERRIENVLRGRLAPLEVVVLRACKSLQGKCFSRSPSAGAPVSSNHCFTRERSPMAAACGRSSGSGQMRVSRGMRCVLRVGERELDGLRRGGGWRRRIAGSRSSRAAMNAPRSFSVAFPISPA